MRKWVSTSGCELILREFSKLFCWGDHNYAQPVPPPCSSKECDNPSMEDFIVATWVILSWTGAPLIMPVLLLAGCCDGDPQYSYEVPTPPPERRDFTQTALNTDIDDSLFVAVARQRQELAKETYPQVTQPRPPTPPNSRVPVSFEEAAQLQQQTIAEIRNPIFGRPLDASNGQQAASRSRTSSSSGVISQQPSAMPSPVPILSGKEIIFTPNMKSLLGQGGFGMVYKGRWDNIHVAVKQLKESFVNEEATKQFATEIATMAKLRHPHVVIMYGAVTDVAPHCIVMELMTESLQKILLDSKRQLSWDTRYRYGSDVASGMSYLHSQRIIHRDLKTGNVLADQEGRLKISDFGLAKVLAETTQQGQKAYYMGESAGTVSHMAPELLGLKARYSEYSDAYAFGMLLWEISSRQLPYKGVDQQIIIASVKNGEREDIPSDTPHVMKEVIENCWAVEPKNRPVMTNIFKRLQAATVVQDAPITTQPQFADNLATAPLTTK